ncbi:hypothetical protein A2625_02080 [candidate division WOR-1 bacterium RIFCSPHIGHO2_01_FULL_53_15]|uniref:Flagellar hook-length control protein-like C-terminal domain-containing protein n=1 Tax=candidate division WOR-1 bacterium RIFCSPHIGHO2_01_FULL_53_15 TaxID=1802564 RepID=A0A1F4PYP1_UNCSA|nr:MAG: hypothetical protein A2625_02080 [candidate division WOR-1 bacterium RIFCSPHIGHO2_01_FULL_53_15]OGC10691.1 MAG: hypothetical protein A3D23_00770 [candidate division WOR-1 bacterium RIFCSPHIGHO2_02_FULL_53_26]
MGEMKTSGGGIHPGQPIIWPTGKPTSTPVSSAQETQTPGGVRTSVPQQAAPVKPSEAAAPATQARPAAPTPSAPSVARPLTVEDIRSHLLSLQVEPNDLNTKLASLMLRNGLEVSRGNLVKIFTMLQGTDKSSAMQEASVLLLMKGLDSPQAVKILGQFFSENPAQAAQMMALHNGLGNLTSALGMGKGLLDPALISQLTALLGAFDSTLENMTSKFATKSSAFSRGQAVNDMRALKALLQGLQNKAPAGDSAAAQALASALMEFQGKLDGLMQNMVAQAILSQSGRSAVNYHYQQIPNTMTTPTKDFEIVIKRDGEGKEARIDPRNTQVVMSMQTTNMGKMVVSLIVKDNKVYVIFVFNEKEYGDQGRSLIAKDFGEFQQKLADKNFLITGYQVKIDPAMANIKPYLIPMLPRLEDLLKRIDLEA